VAHVPVPLTKVKSKVVRANALVSIAAVDTFEANNLAPSRYLLHLLTILPCTARSPLRMSFCSDSPGANIFEHSQSQGDEILVPKGWGKEIRHVQSGASIRFD
jgi:hypothetical protein